jgi:long-chain acyl-CoA synthetase
MSESASSPSEPPGTLASFLEGLGGRGDHPAVIKVRGDSEHRWSYADLAGRIEQLARGLSAAGIGRGDVVSLLGEESPEWIAAALATMRIGAQVSPLDVQLDGKTLAHVLDDSRPGVLFTTPAQLGRLRERPERLPRLALLEGEDADMPPLEPGRDQTPFPEPQPGDFAALFYTSGTTGPPKGVPLTHANLRFQLDALERLRIVGPGDRVLLPLPLHHVYPFVVGMLVPLSLGLPLILPESLTGPRIVKALRRSEATVLIGVPRLYRTLVEGIERRARGAGRIAGAGFSATLAVLEAMERTFGRSPGRWVMRGLHRRLAPGLRLLASGGSALDRDLSVRLRALGWRPVTGYGLTETSPLLAVDLPESLRPGSAGRPVPGVELRIDAEEGPGEVLARGPGVFGGYRNLPDRTAEVLTGDGWFRTGDLGHFDSDGWLFLSGRASTLIVTEGGENIQPDALEAAYEEDAAIQEIGVFLQDRRLAAVVVPDPSVLRGDDPEGRVRDAVNARARKLPSYQRIGDVVISREPLDRTRLGKIKRHRLEERYREISEGRSRETEGPMSVESMGGSDRALLEDPTARAAWDWLVERYPELPLGPDSHFAADLGVDSLEWLNLTLELSERTGVELGDEALERIETLRDLLRETLEAQEAGVAGAMSLDRPEESLGERERRMIAPLGPAAAATARVLYGVNRLLMGLAFRVRARGVEHLPRGGPWVLVANHLSHLDPPVIAAVMDQDRLRDTYWAGWTGVIWSNALLRLVTRLAQAIPVDPARGRSALVLASALLQRGKGLVWFPEGERAPDGELQPLRPGIGLLLDRVDVPVVVCAIHGTFEALPRGRVLPRLRRVRLVFDEPCSVQSLREEGEGDKDPQRITDALARRLARLVEQGP